MRGSNDDQLRAENQHLRDDSYRARIALQHSQQAVNELQQRIENINRTKDAENDTIRQELNKVRRENIRQETTLGRTRAELEEQKRRNHELVDIQSLPIAPPVVVPPVPAPTAPLPSVGLDRPPPGYPIIYPQSQSVEEKKPTDITLPTLGIGAGVGFLIGLAAFGTLAAALVGPLIGLVAAVGVLLLVKKLGPTPYPNMDSAYEEKVLPERGKENTR